jgi:hypothetical protein
MPIVNSIITKQRDRGNGRLAVYEQHTDHNGDVHEHRYSCPVGHDTDQALIDWIPKLNVSLIEGELESYQQAIEEGADPASITVKHISANQKAKRIVRALMLGSPERMLKAAQFVKGKTNAQIENFFTAAQRVRIRTRQNYILNNQAVFDGDEREEL